MCKRQPPLSLWRRLHGLLLLLLHGLLLALPLQTRLHQIGRVVDVLMHYLQQLVHTLIDQPLSKKVQHIREGDGNCLVSAPDGSSDGTQCAWLCTYLHKGLPHWLCQQPIQQFLFLHGVEGRLGQGHAQLLPLLLLLLIYVATGLQG